MKFIRQLMSVIIVNVVPMRIAGWKGGWLQQWHSFVCSAHILLSLIPSFQQTLDFPLIWYHLLTRWLYDLVRMKNKKSLFPQTQIWELIIEIKCMLFTLETQFIWNFSVSFPFGTFIMFNRYEEAEKDCTQAIFLDGSYSKAFARRGTARTFLGKLNEAKQGTTIFITTITHPDDPPKLKRQGVV